MKLSSSNQSIARKLSDTCVVTEFPMGDDQLNFATSRISGRYPEKKRVMNRICKEIAYVQEGSGKIVINDKVYNLNVGDLVMIEPGEKYYWDGNMVLHMSCQPAFTPEQHSQVE